MIVRLPPPMPGQPSLCLLDHEKCGPTCPPKPQAGVLYVPDSVTFGPPDPAFTDRLVEALLRPVAGVRCTCGCARDDHSAILADAPCLDCPHCYWWTADPSTAPDGMVPMILRGPADALRRVAPLDRGNPSRPSTR